METIYFQDLNINWSKASKEYTFDRFTNQLDLKTNNYL